MTFKQWFDDMQKRYQAYYGGYEELLQEAFEAGAKQEREACHALRQTLQNPYTHCQVSAHACDMAYVEYGKAIRARGEA